jgi:hypothetical protein
MKGIPVSLRSFARKLILGACCILGFSAVVQGADLFAQQRGPTQRVVQGKVVDADNAAIKGAVIYLKDSRSLSVKSFFSDAEGNYRFGQLSQTSDYEIWAENNGKKSAVKSISSFDNKNQFIINLKVDK